MLSILLVLVRVAIVVTFSMTDYIEYQYVLNVPTLSKFLSIPYLYSKIPIHTHTYQVIILNRFFSRSTVSPDTSLFKPTHMIHQTHEDQILWIAVQQRMSSEFEHWINQCERVRRRIRNLEESNDCTQNNNKINNK